jgi:hypothetical protein
VKAQLIWPEGHFFERTEIASKELRENWVHLNHGTRGRMINGDLDQTITFDGA